MILGDAKFTELLNAVLAQELGQYDVYLGGSIIRGKARDLDVFMVGEWDYEVARAIALGLEPYRKIDLYFQEEPPQAYQANDLPHRVRSTQWIGENPTGKWQAKGQFNRGFLTRWFALPNGKSTTQGHAAVEPIHVIQNGEQIYF